MRCILSKFYIKPQQPEAPPPKGDGCILSKFYIKPQRLSHICPTGNSCILSKFYIKPQQRIRHKIGHSCCILSKFYIKPQRYITSVLLVWVVSYRNSTSNHNPTVGVMSLRSLYLIEILHQTTTAAWDEAKREQLYLIEILHQTTTFDFRPRFSPGCILSKFYIKPQQCPSPVEISTVVSYRNSTSNHNSFVTITAIRRLYLIEILHQTTTTTLSRCPAFRLYLIEILHQTTTVATDGTLTGGCILSKFYIKPQLLSLASYLFSRCILSKFYIKPQQGPAFILTLFGCILSKFYIKPQHLSYISI